MNYIQPFWQHHIFTTLFSLIKSTGVVCNFPRSNFSTLLFKFLKAAGTFFHLSSSNLYASDFELAKSVFLAKPDASTSVAFFKSAFFFFLHN